MFPSTSLALRLVNVVFLLGGYTRVMWEMAIEIWLAVPEDLEAFLPQKWKRLDQTYYLSWYRCY